MAVAMVAFDDLLSSLDDISNNTWGNKLAREFLHIGDDAQIWVARMQGLFFKSSADRANYNAAMSATVLANMNDDFANVGIWIDNMIAMVERAVAKVRAVVAIATGTDPKTAAAEYKKALLGIGGPKAYQDTASKVVAGYSKSYAFSQTHPASTGPGTATKRGHSVSVNAPITIHASPGMDEKKIGEHVNKHIERQVKNALRTADAAGVER
jgi:hypothetical protein